MRQGVHSEEGALLVGEAGAGREPWRVQAVPPGCHSERERERLLYYTTVHRTVNVKKSKLLYRNFLLSHN